MGRTLDVRDGVIVYNGTATAVRVGDLDDPPPAGGAYNIVNMTNTSIVGTSSAQIGLDLGKALQSNFTNVSATTSTIDSTRIINNLFTPGANDEGMIYIGEGVTSTRLIANHFPSGTVTVNKGIDTEIMQTVILEIVLIRLHCRPVHNRQLELLINI